MLWIAIVFTAIVSLLCRLTMKGCVERFLVKKQNVNVHGSCALPTTNQYNVLECDVVFLEYNYSCGSFVGQPNDVRRMAMMSIRRRIRSLLCSLSSLLLLVLSILSHNRLRHLISSVSLIIIMALLGSADWQIHLMSYQNYPQCV